MYCPGMNAKLLQEFFSVKLVKKQTTVPNRYSVNDYYMNGRNNRQQTKRKLEELMLIKAISSSICKSSRKSAHRNTQNVETGMWTERGLESRQPLSTYDNKPKGMYATGRDFLKQDVNKRSIISQPRQSLAENGERIMFTTTYPRQSLNKQQSGSIDPNIREQKRSLNSPISFTNKIEKTARVYNQFSTNDIANIQRDSFRSGSKRQSS